MSLRTKVTKKEVQRKRRYADLITISIIITIIVVATIVSLLQKDNTKNDVKEKSEEQQQVEFNMGIAKAFADYINSTANSEDIEASIQGKKIINKKMGAPTEIQSETAMEDLTETPTEVPTEVPTEEPTKSYLEEDLYWLSHVIMAEVGNSTYESKAMCGLVVINRVNSHSFAADTIKSVILSPGQYETVSNRRIYMDPDEEAIEIAKKILSGTIEIQIPPNVVYQAEFEQGSGVYCQIGNEYYCYE